MSAPDPLETWTYGVDICGMTVASIYQPNSSRTPSSQKGSVNQRFCTRVLKETFNPEVLHICLLGNNRRTSYLHPVGQQLFGHGVHGQYHA